jgi:nucleoside 2-deoxyribosyltransferase
MPRCFVIQPFDKGPYDKRYKDVLVPAVTDAGFEPYRVDEDPSVTIPIEDIERGIRDAEICLADITTNNPNIWYEVGFALANGRPVVMICADPRIEPYPFDVRHRQVISYTLHSSSDFEKLKTDITMRLRAQAKKAEELQTAATMSQVKGETEGLSPHEISVLMTIMSNTSTPNGGMAAHEIKQAMERSGFTPVASTLAIAGLTKKRMIEIYDCSDSDGWQFSSCRLCEEGIDWMLANENRFSLTTRRVIRRSPDTEPGPITDDDIPF